MIKQSYWLSSKPCLAISLLSVALIVADWATEGCDEGSSHRSVSQHLGTCPDGSTVSMEFTFKLTLCMQGPPTQ